MTIEPNNGRMRQRAWMQWNKTTSWLAVLVGLVAFMLPWQTRWIALQGISGGSAWEWGTISIYAIDLLILVLVTIGGYRWLRTNRKTGSIHLDRIDSAALLVAVITWASVLISNTPELAVFWAVQTTKAILVFAAVRRAPIAAAIGLTGAAVIQSVLSIVQFIAQRIAASSLFGIAAQDPAIPGVQVIEMSGERILRAYGSFPHPNILGGFLALVIIIVVLRVLRGRTNWLILFLPPLSAGLWFTLSRQAIIAVIIGIATGIYLRWLEPNASGQRNFKEEAVAIGIAAILPLLLLSGAFPSITETRIEGTDRLEQRSTQERTGSYTEGIETILDAPLTGHGIGQYTAVNAIDAPGYEKQPTHNVLLLIWAEIGAIGLFAVLYILLQIITQYPFRAIPMLAAMTPLLLLDHYLWSLPVGLLLFWIIIGYSSPKK